MKTSDMQFKNAHPKGDFIFSRLEIKSLEEDGSFEGYGNTFDLVDYVGDAVAKGAFKRTLKEAKKSGITPKLLWQHDSRQPIGVWKEMEEDDKGLFVKGQLIKEVRQGAEAYALLKAGAIDAMSIGYVPVKWKFDNESGIRTLTDVDLWEISLVTFPANKESRVTGVKSAAEEIKTIREFETFLRDVGGFSASKAKVIASTGFAASNRDGDDEAIKSIQRTIKLLKGE